MASLHSLTISVHAINNGDYDKNYRDKWCPLFSRLILLWGWQVDWGGGWPCSHGGGISQLGLKPMWRFSSLFLISVEYLEPKHVDPRMCELLVLLAFLVKSLSSNSAVFFNIVQMGREGGGVKPMLKKYRFRNGILTKNWHKIAIESIYNRKVLSVCLCVTKNDHLAQFCKE